MMDFVEYKKIVSKISIPADCKIKQKAYLQSGTLPVVDQGQKLIGGYTDERQKQIICDLPVIVFGDHTKCVKYVNFPFCAGADGIKILKARNDIFPKYLYYGTVFLTYCIEDKGYARHYQHIEKQELFVPPLPEQERIVAKIEELFSQLDAAVAELKSVKEKLAIYRQAVLKEAFEKHDDWEIYQLDDLMESVKNGYGKKPTDSGEYRILKISAVRALVLDLDESRLNRFPFEEGDLIHENDLLFTRYNGSRELVGVCAVVPKLSIDYAYPDKIIRCIPKKNSVAHSKFLSYYLNHGEARKFILSKIKTTSGQNGISGSDLKRTEIYLPNDEIQENIVSQIEEKLSVCNDIEQTVDTALQQAAALRQSILKQAFEGNL